MTEAGRERDLASRFLDSYNRLDQYMRKRLDVGLGVRHVKLIKSLAQVDPVFQNRQTELEELAHLRNAIVHNPLEPIAEPHEDVVRRYEQLVSQVLQPVLAKECAVPAERIFTATWSDSVVGVVAEMNRCVYTHVPILEEGRVIGVFSENTTFCALGAMKAVSVTEDTTISEFREFVPIRKHVSECFEFTTSDATLESVAQMFADRLKLQQRLGAVFLTDDGAEAGRLLGLVTVWDIAGTKVAIGKLAPPNPGST
jgi:CBS domain-containing protein